MFDSFPKQISSLEPIEAGADQAALTKSFCARHSSACSRALWGWGTVWADPGSMSHGGRSRHFGGVGRTCSLGVGQSSSGAWHLLASVHVHAVRLSEWLLYALGGLPPSCCLHILLLCSCPLSQTEASSRRDGCRFLPPTSDGLPWCPGVPQKGPLQTPVPPDPKVSLSIHNSASTLSMLAAPRNAHCGSRSPQHVPRSPNHRSAVSDCGQPGREMPWQGVWRGWVGLKGWRALQSQLSPLQFQPHTLGVRHSGH